MKILAIGDVVSGKGCDFLRKHLPNLKREHKVDLVIANGENSADGNGILPTSLNHLYTSGVDIVTTGNHSFRRKEIYNYYDEEEYLIRPANFPNSAPGKGYCIYDMGRVQVCVINVMGTVYLESLKCPFETVDEILKKTSECKIHIVDFHAEATGEKRALAFYLDGRVSALFGTHTHVQTADEGILPNGTGYITDLGMVGAINSVLGIKPENAIAKMKGKIPVRFENEDSQYMLNGALFEIDDKTGKTISVQRINIK